MARANLESSIQLNNEYSLYIDPSVTIHCNCKKENRCDSTTSPPFHPCGTTSSSKSLDVNVAKRAGQCAVIPLLKMQCVKTFVLLCFLVSLGWADTGITTSTVYEKECRNTSECTFYPNITQGPQVIWIPFYCNEDNLCVCPDGWTPLLIENICVTRISGSTTEDACVAYIWTISFIVVSLLVLITYSCISLFSRPSVSTSIYQKC